MNANENLFYSFWQGGYEGADHANSAGHPLGMNDNNQHRTRVREDYLHLQPFGIRTIRESIGWRMAEPTPNHYDFSFLEPSIEVAQEFDLQILWTLCHYSWPCPRSARNWRRWPKMCPCHNIRPGTCWPVR